MPKFKDYFLEREILYCFRKQKAPAEAPQNHHDSSDIVYTTEQGALAGKGSGPFYQFGLTPVSSDRFRSISGGL